MYLVRVLLPVLFKESSYNELIPVKQHHGYRYKLQGPRDRRGLQPLKWTYKCPWHYYLPNCIIWVVFGYHGPVH